MIVIETETLQWIASVVALVCIVGLVLEVWRLRRRINQHGHGLDAELAVLIRNHRHRAKKSGQTGPPMLPTGPKDDEQEAEQKEPQG